MMLSKKKTKELMGKGRMMKARCHIGMNGVQPNTLQAFKKAFEGTCVRPEPSEIIRVKVHPSYTGDVAELIAILENSNGSMCVGGERCFLTFYLPKENAR